MAFLGARSTETEAAVWKARARRPLVLAPRQQIQDRAEAWAHGLRAAAAELTEAPNGRRAQEASGRRLQGANGPAEASGTRLNGRAAWMRGPPFWREIAARCMKRDARAGARGCTVQVSRARRAAFAAHRSRARTLGCLRASRDSLGHPRRAQAVPRSS